jgi:hypothetical protein
MIPLTALAVTNSATSIAFTLEASIIMAWFPNRPYRWWLLEQEDTSRHGLSFLRRPLRATTESSPGRTDGEAIAAAVAVLRNS